MKKILLVLVVSVFVGLTLSACHAYEECPAYGQVEEAPAESNG